MRYVNALLEMPVEARKRFFEDCISKGMTDKDIGVMIGYSKSYVSDLRQGCGVRIKQKKAESVSKYLETPETDSNKPKGHRLTLEQITKLYAGQSYTDISRDPFAGIGGIGNSDVPGWRCSSLV